MLRRIKLATILGAWLGFLGFVSWWDWHGGFTYAFAKFNVWFDRGVFYLGVIVLLIALRAVLRSVHMAQVQRWVLVLGIVWLLVLPFIIWRAEKGLIVRSALLIPGMSESQVRTTMAGFRDFTSGVGPATGGFRIAFCTDDPLCETSTNVDFISGRVVSVWFDTD